MKKSSDNFFWKKIVEIYQQTVKVLKNDPTVWILFVVLMMLELLALGVLFLSHSEPVSFILAPLIRTFYSDRFLHYPHNFVLLPKLLNHAHFLITTVIGVIISGIVIKKIEGQLVEKKVRSMYEAGQRVLNKYFALVIAWLLTYFIFRFTFNWLMPFFAVNAIVYLTGAFLLGLLIQSLLVFLIPAILINEAGWFKSLIHGFTFAFFNLPRTLLLLALPMLLVVIVGYFKVLTPVYMEVNPELVLLVLATSVVIMTVVDYFITASATVLYLKARNKK